ncbi:MAG: ABC transporter permease subunit [Kiritimatiellae bacterium]|nr:ABC transporter permease subunit [Kiritimatiellia bacterium]MDD5522821.1 ABC transporter permease subunit [Kiritimatiellia bacterium]
MTRILTIAHTVWLGTIRKKDIYVLLILLGALLLAMVSLDVFGLGGAVRYVKDLGLLTAWFFSWILAVNISARELPTEETNGTVFPLLAKPITRAELIAGKWLGTWSVAVISTMFFYLLIIAVVKYKGGSFEFIPLAQAIILHSSALSVICAIALAFSTRMNHDAATSITYILTGAAFFIVPRVPEFMARETGFAANMLMLIYNLLPHFEVFDMRKRLVHDFGPATWKIFFIVLCYGALISFTFILISWLAYRNKRFSRGNLI